MRLCKHRREGTLAVRYSVAAHAARAVLVRSLCESCALGQVAPGLLCHRARHCQCEVAQLPEDVDAAQAVYA